jgi:hypothetical protein
MKYYIVLIAVILLCSCKTQIRYIPLIETRTDIQTRTLTDSIYILDSVFIQRTKDNDTVWIYEYRNKYIYKYINRIDSFILTDSIPYPVEVFIDKIVYKRSFWDNLQIY